MKRYLLDTSICVFLFRGKYGIAERLNAIGYDQCHISDVTIAELYYGAYRSDRPKENLALIDRFVDKVGIVPFACGVDEFAREKNRLCRQGTPVEDFDLLIASAAKVMGMILVTDNLKHFRKISALTIENWIER